MTDRKIIEALRSVERDLKALDARGDSAQAAIGGLAKIGARRALEEDCRWRAWIALWTARAEAHDQWAERGWWWRLFHRPPGWWIPVQQVMELAVKIRDDELRAAVSRQTAEAAVAAQPDPGGTPAVPLDGGLP